MILLLWAAPAEAKSWCASRVVAHEWGVAVLAPGGGLVPLAQLPPWFERSGVQPVAGGRVRDLPADNGVRTLPVVQFWRGDTDSGTVPLALEVGFTQGSALVWYPPVDTLNLADPARQLIWESLTLDSAPAQRPAVTDLAWVQSLRAAEGALWVERGQVTERFVFYEGRTREQPAVVARVDGGVVKLRNRGDWPVYDVRVFRGPAVGALDVLRPGEERAVTLLPSTSWAADLRERWVDPAGASVTPRVASGDGCVMMRDPAVPVSTSTGHALYASEVDALWSVWGAGLGGGGDHLLYREDPAALDAVMPVSLYTDMRHWIDWRRLSVVLVPGG